MPPRIPPHRTQILDDLTDQAAIDKCVVGWRVSFEDLVLPHLSDRLLNTRGIESLVDLKDSLLDEKLLVGLIDDRFAESSGLRDDRHTLRLVLVHEAMGPCDRGKETFRSVTIV